MMKHTTYEVARMTGVTLRTLRYYDKIGLLKPTAYSQAGYRLYGKGELKTLQQILFFRELDFPLAKIAELLHQPDFDRALALEAQAKLLKKKADRYEKLSDLAEKTLLSLKGEIDMPEQELFDGFDYEEMLEQQKQYEDEVQSHWGNTEAYRVSRQRAAGYGKEDWQRIQQEQAENMRELAACHSEGIPCDAPRIQLAVEQARALINKYFYPCSAEMMGNLGAMYMADERFRKTYDDIAPGLAEYYSAAIKHYVEASGKTSEKND